MKKLGRFIAAAVVATACNGAGAPTPAPETTAPTVVVSSSPTPAETATPSRSPSSPPTATPFSWINADRTPVPGLPMTGRIVFALEFGPDAQFNANIFTIEPDGSDIRQITHYEAAKAVGPAWSPDGDRIFFSLLDPAESESSHVWSMDAAGGDLVQLTSEEDAADGEPDMSPDGKQIAFRRCVGCANAAPGEDLGAIVLLSTSDLSVVQVTHPTKADGDGDSAPMFSPDGRTLAFTRMGAVWTVGVDGTNLRRMTEPVLDASRPRWSADGERLFFTGAAGLMALTLASGDVEELSGAEFGTPSWSPNGEWMVFHRWPGDPYIGLYIAEPDGSNPIEIWRTPRQTDYFIYWTDWGTAP